MRRVAVTGLGVVSPLGNGAQDFFDRLVRATPASHDCRRTSILDCERVVAPVSFDGAPISPRPACACWTV